MFAAGLFHYRRNRRLQRRYCFDRWHITPIEWRPYALELVKQINYGIGNDKIDTVVEIGCGLGEILSKLNCRNRIGLDAEQNVIRAAEKLYKHIDFRHGSFPDIKSRKIDVLIAVNFLHNIPLDELQRIFREILDTNKIRYIALDKVPLKHNHDLESLLDGFEFQKLYESNYFKGERKLFIFMAKKEPARLPPE